MTGLAFDLDQNDDTHFVERHVKPLVEGVLRVVNPMEIYLVKVDSWFGDKWLGFSNKELGAFGVQYRDTLRVPPFVPARVRAERFFRRVGDHEYADTNAPSSLHVAQTSKANARRLMSIVCPNAALFWWSGESRSNGRGSLMAYLPTSEGHAGWYVEFKRSVETWSTATTLGTTTAELAAYVTGTVSSS